MQQRGDKMNKQQIIKKMMDRIITGGGNKLQEEYLKGENENLEKELLKIEQNEIIKQRGKER